MYRLQEQQHGVAADMKLQTWADTSKNVSRHLLDVAYSNHCSPDSNRGAEDCIKGTPNFTKGESFIESLSKVVQ